MASNFFNEKNESSRYEVLFLDIMLDTVNTDPDWGRTDFYNDPDCYETPKTTDDLEAYNPNEPKKRYRLSTSDLGSGAGIHFPILNKSSMSGSETELTIGEISVSSTFSIKIFDIKTNDTYQLSENYADRRVKNSSFLGTLIARNYIENREAYLYRGFLSPGEDFNIENFEKERYIIKNLKRNSDGGATINLVDPLFKATSQKGKAPQSANGVLEYDITSTATSMTIYSASTIVREVDGTEQSLHEYSLAGDGYPGKSVYLCLDSEIIKLSTAEGDYVLDSSDTDLMHFYNIERAQFDTEADSHDADTSCDKCLQFESSTIPAALIDILKNHLDVKSFQDDPDNGFFDEDEWNAVNFNDIELNGISVTDETATDVIDNILSICNGSIFWDPVLSKLVLFTSYDTPDPVYSFSYSENIEDGSLTVTQNTNDQITRQTIYFGKYDFTGSEDDSNYAESYTYIDGTVEDDSNIGVVNSADDIYTSFLDRSATSTQTAILTATEIVNRDSGVPLEFEFKTDIQSIGYTSLDSDGNETNRVWVGSYINVYSDLWLSSNGEPDEKLCLVTSVKRNSDSLWTVKCSTFNYEDYSGESSSVDFTIDYDYVATETDGSLNIGDLFSDLATEERQYTVLITSGSRIVGVESDDGLSTITAIDTGTEEQWPNGLKLVIRGNVIGAAGKGGNGGDYSEFESGGEGYDGLDGGDCILNRLSNLVIDNGNAGIIWAGGGGAGGNGTNLGFGYNVAAGGSSGAGGSISQYVDLNETGMAGGTGYSVRSNFESTKDGSASSDEGPGLTRPTVYGSDLSYDYVPSSALFTPADGGDFGADGSSGEAPYITTTKKGSKSTGGKGGYAVRNYDSTASYAIIAGDNSTQIKGYRS